MRTYWRLSVVLGIFASFSFSCASEIVRLRGVSPMLNMLYEFDGEVFVCLDGRRTMKYAQVNDNYCDCYDGSDEPGTNACNVGKFHCSNVGYHFKDISSSRVDDGICDCCDGSDERISLARCVINCNELGRIEMNQIKAKTEVAMKGIKLKYEMRKEGRSLGKQYNKQFIELEQRKKELELLVDAKTHLKNEMEMLEQEAIASFKKKQKLKTATTNIESADLAFVELDIDKNGLIDITDVQTRIEFDRDQDGLVSVEEAKFFMHGLQNISKDEFVSIWPTVKEYLQIKSDSSVSQSQEVDVSEAQRLVDLGDEEIPSGDEEISSGDEEISDNKFEAETETFSGAGTDDHPGYDADTLRFVNDANNVREDLRKTNKQLEDLVTDLRNVERWMQIDYGDEWEFATLNGKCFSFEDREYTYKFCPFQSTSQKQNVGGMEISLGTWTGWSENAAKYQEMLYNGGASCWNGPQRSAKVKLECGIDQVVTSVLEPIRCEYELVFQTPAACNVTVGLNHFHDEL